jgi:hypothetical protein
MRHVLFVLLLPFSGLLALIFSFPFMMSECQLNDTQAAIDRCFAANNLGLTIYTLTALGFLVAALWLHIRKSRWSWLAVLCVGVAPLGTVLLLTSLRS